MPDKASLRKELLKKREAIPPEVRRVKNRLIRDRLASIGEIKNASILFFFASFRTEVDTSEMIKTTLSEGKRVVLPKVDKERQMLVLYEIKTVEELVEGYMGIPEPSVNSGERRVDINNVDAVIIPGAGFDAEGNRIGYGGGYYDRLLSELKREIPIIAPAYEEQIVDSIPSEHHDIRVHLIVTDRRVIQCTQH
jgi:5-formyltetrahydrofolate cyclo-ligase